MVPAITPEGRAQLAAPGLFVSRDPSWPVPSSCERRRFGLSEKVNKNPNVVREHNQNAQIFSSCLSELLLILRIVWKPKIVNFWRNARCERKSKLVPEMVRNSVGTGIGTNPNALFFNGLRDLVPDPVPDP